MAFGLLLLLLKKLFLRKNQFSYPENWPKIKFPEKSQKIQNIIFLEKRGRVAPEMTQGPPLDPTPVVGMGPPLVVPRGVWPTWAPPGCLLKATFFLSPEKHRKTCSSSSSCCSCSRFSISLLSPSQVLILGGIVPWYVPPPLVQLDL